jgi:hypothetical protein
MGQATEVKQFLLNQALLRAMNTQSADQIGKLLVAGGDPNVIDV